MLFSCTVAFAVLSQPFSSVTTTLYEPASTSRERFGLKLFHWKSEPSLAVSLVISPGHTFNVPLILAGATVYSVTLTVVSSEQPLLSRTTTLCIPIPTDTPGLFELPALADHWKPLAPPPCRLALNSVCPFGHTCCVPVMIAVGFGLIIKRIAVR